MNIVPTSALTLYCKTQSQKQCAYFWLSVIACFEREGLKALAVEAEQKFRRDLGIKDGALYFVQNDR